MFAERLQPAQKWAQEPRFVPSRTIRDRLLSRCMYWDLAEGGGHSIHVLKKPRYANFLRLFKELAISLMYYILYYISPQIVGQNGTARRLPIFEAARQ